MDFIKSSLWLLLAMISVYKSECKSFHKYRVSTSETSNENCFCFISPGVHQTVPEILNQKNHNLERLVIYLYKDKITGHVKMYTPNEEKQDLVPDLAFEVGDKLVSVDDVKIRDIFTHTINAVVDQQPHVEANIAVLPIEPNKFQYYDHVDHVHPQVDINGVLSQENNTPDIYVINSHEYYVDTNSVQSEKINKPSDVMYDTQNKYLQVETNRKPSKIIDIIPELIYGGHDSSEISFEKFIPSKPDVRPASDWNILQQKQPYVDTISILDQHVEPIALSKQINVPGEVMYPDNDNYHGQQEHPHVDIISLLDPHIDTIAVSNQINVPGKAMYPDNVYNHEQQKQPQVDTISVLDQHVEPIAVSKQINVPGEVIYPDNGNYHGQQEQTHVDTISVLEPLYVPGEVTYEQPYVDDSSVLKQINVPGQAMNPDNINYLEQHENPFIDYIEVSKQTNVPHLVENPDAHYHVLHEQPLPGSNNEAEPIGVPSEYIHIYDPHFYADQAIPSQNSEHTFIVDGKLDGNWNIPSEWIYEPTIDSQPHRYSKEYVDNVLLKSSEESEEIESSEGHKSYETIAESGSDLDFSDENSSKSKENNSIEYSQSNESDLSQENEIIESREVVKDSNELEIIAVIAGTKIDKTKSHNHSINQYETFDRWFIHQMQRFQTFTEHDKAINIVDIERCILNILYDNGMHVTSEGVLTDSFGTALDVHKLHLRPILIGNPLAVGRILTQVTKDLVMPANMAYLQAILVTNANPSLILGIIPIGKTVIPPSARNTLSTVLKPHVRQDSSIVLAKHPTLASTHQTWISSGKPVLLDAGRHLQHDSENHWRANKKNKSVRPEGKTVLTYVKTTPVIMHHRHRQPVKSIKVYGTAEDEKVSFLSKNSAESVNMFMGSLSEPEGPLSSADATNKLLSALRSEGSLFTSSEESYELDEDDIAGRIVGGSAATGSGAPLSMKGRMKDF